MTDFSHENAISQLALAELRSKDHSDYRLSYRVYGLIRMRNVAKIDQAPYRFRGCLYSTIVHTAETDANNHWNNVGTIYEAE